MKGLGSAVGLSRNQRVCLGVVLCLGVLLLSGSSRAPANERRFTWVYESSVLSPGARELEVWNTYRSGKTYFFRRLDQRLEFEFGVAERLMTSLYLNTEWKAADDNGTDAGGAMRSELDASVSSEWKYKMFDRVADPLGVALYGEFTLGLHEREVELKIILDKQVGPFLVAGNLVGEQEWKDDVRNGIVETGREVKLEINGGISYSVTGHFAFGIEAVQQNIMVGGEIEHAALFAGPVVTYATDEWWVTLTVLPQFAGLKGATAGGLDLDEFERSNVRLLLSFHL
jgi:hypothetical protein